MNRTHNNGELRLENVGQVVELKGWVAKSRNLGGLVFIDLRDRYGMTQLVANPETVSPEVLEVANKVRNEYVIAVKGIVAERQSKNPNMPTGDIEVVLEQLTIISEAEMTPLIIADETDALEDTRLKYRYLDLRRPMMQKNFILRHNILKSVRSYLDSQDFIEVETPYLNKSTPEGARDYLVPSRVHEGEFYALPQSPQIFKQLLMVSGFERYYQVARCFRDEDLRADRQPEFTQIDIETSFLTQEEIMNLVEEMLVKMMKDVKGLDIPRPFPRLSYEEAMGRYGSDKPDTRFEMELIPLNHVVANCGFSVFASTVEAGNEVKALCVKGAAERFSRKDIDKLTDFVKKYKAKGLAWVKVVEEGFNGPIAKFFNEDEVASIKAATNAEIGDLLLFVADTKAVVADSLGALRLHLAKELGLIDESKFNFLWVIDWPLFEYDEEAGRFFAAHHPFTMPSLDTLDTFDTDSHNAKAQAYDIVLNGYELGGGSLRIYRPDIQSRMFEALGFTKEEAEEQFGFLMNAFKYGTPPHGGLALGLDRIAMILTGSQSLRDVIAFPKNASATCPMTEAPGRVSEAQLTELHIQLKK
ncbi:MULTISPECIES: aspartate--tRNA ligase [Turicibacter]|uniref:Aspartate--tRNA ligase n=3 Tax=Turicibacter sanguinis TaxID=154288 RepID=A0A9X4XDC9_9FIRM|nr:MULTISPECIES: aspartate--tRNA ligase [Turicibacter]EFF64234.1 aspartate--tRNA ligase [Turicibacter sanguinis PC909]MBP3903462.1 aspartate--tRNA ligase [Turicibacter sp.]MCU7191175.1 aspartate--tRNA ligase [Turicibacter sanguinis]MCU7201400.1 aspartate--tRNA ligase [Turicibacter sanguinis]MDB8436558.1 aspartate--tRNA ligase [Turicibacter sanguinis]